MRLIFDLDGLIYQAAFVSQTNMRMLTPTGETDIVAAFSSADDRDAWLKERGYTKLRVKNALWRDDFEETSRVDIDPEPKALALIDYLIDREIERWNPDEVTGFLSDKKCFRNDIYPEYKANRKDMVKPHHFWAIKDHLEKRGAVTKPNLEADDCVLIEALRSEEEWVIVGEDKDLRQIPGRFWNPKKMQLDTIDELTALKNYWCQVMTGDSTDNIPGIKGIGPKKAMKFLDGLTTDDDMADKAIQVYKDNGIPLVTMSLTKDLIHILRKDP